MYAVPLICCNFALFKKIKMEENKNKLPEISREELEAAKKAGSGSLCELVSRKALESVGGKLDSESMPKLTSSQITIIGYIILRRELLEGGFVQLIHNGYGPFFFENPFAKAMREVGLKELCNMLYDVRRLYEKTAGEITRDCSDEEFMALYEKFEKYDEYDDEYVERETEYTEAVDSYIEANIDEFLTIR